MATVAAPSDQRRRDYFDRTRKLAFFEAIATMGKAIASPRRLETLDLLAKAPRTVDDLARASEQSTANTSQHLQALHAAGLVSRERDGQRVRYALAGDDVLALCVALRNASAERLAEVERAARDYLGDDVEAIGRDELIKRLSDLPANCEIVAYCRGPLCAYAHQAERTLHQAGRTARRLEEGWPEWHLQQAAGKAA